MGVAGWEGVGRWVGRGWEWVDGWAGNWLGGWAPGRTGWQPLCGRLFRGRAQAALVGGGKGAAAAAATASWVLRRGAGLHASVWLGCRLLSLLLSRKSAGSGVMGFK